MVSLQVVFFFNNPATTEIYTLSLHDALPISPILAAKAWQATPAPASTAPRPERDRKSTRLNSSHITISYAVFCLKKKKKITTQPRHTNNKHIADLLLVLSSYL